MVQLEAGHGGATVVEELLCSAEAWVQAELSGTDGSHDWWHIQRVRANAKV